MIDADSVLRSWFASLPNVAGVFGVRVYASVSLPEGYKPSVGQALLFTVRGGPVDFGTNILSPSVQCRVYGETEGKVRQALGVFLRSVLDADNRVYLVKDVSLEQMPQLLLDPETQWPYSLVYLTVVMGNPN